jgi:hypothetical protein
VATLLSKQFRVIRCEGFGHESRKRPLGTSNLGRWQGILRREGSLEAE